MKFVERGRKLEDNVRYGVLFVGCEYCGGEAVDLGGACQTG